MSMTSKTSTFQTAMILGALFAGALVARFLPERHPLAAYVPQTSEIPTTAVFKHANAGKPSHDASRDLSGIGVDVHRLALLGRVS
jgi:hypothetical protein